MFQKTNKNAPHAQFYCNIVKVSRQGNGKGQYFEVCGTTYFTAIKMYLENVFGNNLNLYDTKHVPNSAFSCTKLFETRSLYYHYLNIAGYNKVAVLYKLELKV